jgi:citrate synthase
MIAALAAAAVGAEAVGVEREPPGGVARTFARGWGHARDWRHARGWGHAEGWACRGSGLEALLDAALILCADHELNTSTLAARCAASTRASPYGVVMAGMATLQGPRHGGAAGRVEAMMAEASSGADPTEVVAARLRRGEGIPGFGHPLYPEGDPRATTLLDLLAEEKAGLGEAAASRLALSEDLAEEVERLTDRRPNIDFALATLTAMMGFPSGSALALFAVGRTVGWIAHAIEQYGLEELIRPRARYVGPRPDADSPPEGAP